MKRFLISAVLALAPLGCGAPEDDAPAAIATPMASEESLLIARDEVKWKALYDRIMKDYAAKMIPKKLREAEVDAARAIAEKDLANLQDMIVPHLYGGVNASLLDGFRSLHSGHLYLQMGLQANDKSILESGRKEMRAAAAYFGEARARMQKAMPKPTAPSSPQPGA